MMQPMIPPVSNSEPHPGFQLDVLDGPSGEPLAYSGFEVEEPERDL